jgi:REP element-mobilizing transposase RayT
MNNRDYKNFAAGQIYHLYNRGVGKMDIFTDEEDKKFFLYRIWENFYPELARLRIKSTKASTPRRKYLPSNSFDLISYCLMPNHFHLLVKQNTELPLSHLISKICTGYSKYFNKKYSRVGSLFQDQFKAVRVESNEQLLWLSLYIHNNPFKSGITDDPINYEWSSLLEYVGEKKSSICKSNIIIDQLGGEHTYRDFFENKDKFIQKMYISDSDLLIDSN